MIKTGWKPFWAGFWLSTLAGCNSHETVVAPPVRPVLFVPVEIQKTNVFGPFVGTVQPRYQATLGFQTGGRLVSRDVAVGELVKAGTRLATLDPAVAQFQLSAAVADTANTKAQLTNAQATEDRVRSLLKTGGATQAQLDGVVAAREAAAARVAQAAAGLSTSQDQISRTELRADFDGIVTAWQAEIGQVVTPGQTVVNLARSDVREAVVDVPDALVGDIPAGASFTVVLRVDPTLTAKGTVRQIGPQADQATRTRRIWLSLDSPPIGFRLGTIVSVSLSRSVDPYIDLPATALRSDGSQSSVWVVDPAAGTVGVVAVEVKQRLGDRARIAPTLAAGALVVTAGVHSLTPGESVRVRR